LNLVDLSTGTGDEEIVQVFNAPSSGYYYLKIVGYQEADNSYSLHLALSDCAVSFSKFGQGLAGKGGFVPNLYGTSGGCGAGQHSVNLNGGLGGATAALIVGFKTGDFYPFYGGHLYIDFTGAWQLFTMKLLGTPGVPGAGFIHIPGQDASAYLGLNLYLQMIITDAAAIQGYSLSNALKMSVSY
jgi:hypothetical protein